MPSSEQLKKLTVDQIRKGISKFNKSITLTGYKSMRKPELIQAIVAMKHTALNKELMKFIPKINFKVKKEEPAAVKPVAVAAAVKPVVAAVAEPKIKNLPANSDAVKKLGSKALRSLGMKLKVKMSGSDLDLRERVIAHMNLNKLFK
jgi:hypothetical protein